MTARQVIWTDFGGVLTPPISDTLTRFCAVHGVDRDAFRSAMGRVADRYGTDVMAPLDTPLITEADWAGQVSAVLRDEHDVRVDLSNFADKWFSDRETNQAWVQRLRGLRDDGHTIGLLSNMVPAWDTYWRAMVPPEGLFTHVVLSFQVGHRKPDPGIFEIAASQAGVSAQSCVLVDDLPENCAGARRAGWQAVEFSTADDAGRQLDEVLGRTASRTDPVETVGGS